MMKTRVVVSHQLDAAFQQDRQGVKRGVARNTGANQKSRHSVAVVKQGDRKPTRHQRA